MARNQSRDPLVLSAHWHVDCRLPAELPDDRVVSSRFLVNLPFGMATLGLLIFFGWLLSTDLSLRGNIADWSRRLSDSRVEVATIKQQQREYAALAFKIEAAHTLMKSRLFVSHFMTQLSRSRPGPMIIDNVESFDANLIVRGTLGGSAEQATRAIGVYLDQLRQDEEIGPHFDSIAVTNFDRAPSGNQQNFELTFKFKPEGSP
ncbi:MAG: hypothetical protein WCL24_08090 [Verrucomicrobiota bacterium]